MWRMMMCAMCACVCGHAVVILNEVMSKEDQQKTGVDKLTAGQKSSLEAWIDANYTPKTQGEKVPLSLSENIDAGKRLRLTDGSLYEIFPSDVNKTALWITPFALTLSPSGDSEYPYIITNLVSGSKVKARRLEPPSS